ncbi:hypothetical protein KC330_g1 [Hortaea werneckii]|nr:hypothetical protein KC330_g1 [Hortaea werneckii]
MLRAWAVALVLLLILLDHFSPLPETFPPFPSSSFFLSVHLNPTKYVLLFAPPESPVVRGEEVFPDCSISSFHFHFPSLFKPSLAFFIKPRGIDHEPSSPMLRVVDGWIEMESILSRTRSPSPPSPYQHFCHMGTLLPRARMQGLGKSK